MKEITQFKNFCRYKDNCQYLTIYDSMSSLSRDNFKKEFFCTPRPYHRYHATSECEFITPKGKIKKKADTEREKVYAEWRNAYAEWRKADAEKGILWQLFADSKNRTKLWKKC